MKVYHIPRTSLSDWFGDVRDFVARACELHPFLDAEDVYTLCAQGPCVLTLAMEDDGKVCGCFVSEMLFYPKKRVVNIVLTGGNTGFLANGFRQGLELIEQEARRIGADALSAMGRPGWTRVAPKYGWRSASMTSVWKELGNVEGRREPDHTH